MKLLILKTNISSRKKIRSLKGAFNNYPSINDWWVDLHDTDKVLRIEADDKMEEKEVINLLHSRGLTGETLMD